MQLISFTEMAVKIKSLISCIPASDKAKVLYQFLDQEASFLDNENAQLHFSVQVVEDPFYYGLLNMVSIDVRKKIDCSGLTVITRSFNSWVGMGFPAFLRRSGLLGWLISSQWSKISCQTIGPVGYRSQSFNYPFADLYDFWCAYKLWRSLKNSEDISKLVIHDILVGDLVIDSYLRFRPSPYFLVKDRFVLTVLWQAHRDIRRAYDFFSQSKPSFYLSSLTTYIQHGVAVRVALKLGVPVYIVSSNLVFGKKLSSEDYFHTRDASSYYSIFKKLDQQEEKLKMAETELKQKLSGAVDDTMAYMKNSAYAYSDEKLPNVEGAVVIFLHDFYDSPHVYDELIFQDFWSWICFTVDTLIESGVNFWVKPHPNQISLSDNAVQLLLKHYPQLNMISSTVTNSQLVEAGVICGVTAYGSIAHELAYMGIPSICCAKHPHHSFGFCRTAKTVDEYKHFLEKPNVKLLSVKEMKRQALEFVYMHSYHGDGTIALNREFASYFREVNNIDGAQLVQKLVKFRDLSAYNKLIDELVSEIQISS